MGRFEIGSYDYLLHETNGFIMALELKQSLSLTQQLIMTPQLQQAIRLLQLSRLELVESIQEEIEENPVLEELAADEIEEEAGIQGEKDESDQDVPDLPEVTVEEIPGDHIDWENYMSEYNTGWAESSYEERDIPPIENVTPTKTNLYSHLMWQLNMSNLDEGKRGIGTYIIGNLNEDGYLDVPLEEISQDTGYPMEEVLETLYVIQNFDPVGVAARDTRESLLIQAKFHNLEGTVVEKIIMNHLECLEDKKYDQFAKKLGISVQEVLTAVSIIRGLEPKPGKIYSDDHTIYITPDVYIFKVGDDYEIVLNEDGLPKLRINGYYRDVLSDKSLLSENAQTYIKEKLRSAAWLIKSIHQRQRTIYRVTESIAHFQRDFLDKGTSYLKPLVLRNVAENVEMHESTVSRVTTNKYVQTPQGLFELRFFFNSSIGSFDGCVFASKSVKEHIRKIVKSENKATPYSDQEIADILKTSNIKVARRTVAKYRESMSILPSRKRKNAYI